jgi:SAM-dependent methyltransferase
MLRLIYDHLSPRTKAAAKRLLASSGHRASFLDRLRGKYHAKGKKRYLEVAKNLDQQLTLADVQDLKGKTCVEFGCGYVPTELVYYWALGASKLIAVDYNRIAQFHQLPTALKGAAIPKFDASRIEYLAPFDASKDVLPRCDFIHSEAVLEHVPPSQAPLIVRNLAGSLAPGGIMIHMIDMRDHLDLKGDPNGFLLPSSDYDPERDYDARGNRMRKSNWEKVFAGMEGFSTRCHGINGKAAYEVPGYSREDITIHFLVTVTRRLH